jgi:hypothetical protein
VKADVTEGKSKKNLFIGGYKFVFAYPESEMDFFDECILAASLDKFVSSTTLLKT